MCPELFGVLFAVYSSWSAATNKPPMPAQMPPPAATVPAAPRPAAAPKAPLASDKLPIAGLAPAKIRPNQCLLTYRISTQSKDCQAHFDQGLGYLYSYVWMEAARSFET